MPTTDAAFIRTAMEVSGSLLFAVTAFVTLFGVGVVALSFRRVPEKLPTPARPQR